MTQLIENKPPRRALIATLSHFSALRGRFVGRRFSSDITGVAPTRYRCADSPALRGRRFAEAPLSSPLSERGAADGSENGQSESNVKNGKREDQHGGGEKNNDRSQPRMMDDVIEDQK